MSHGRHQLLWDALVDFAVDHHDQADGCTGKHCPTGDTVLHEQRAVIETADDMREAVDDLLAWSLARCTETLTTNARTAAAEAGPDHQARIVLSGDGPIATLAGQLLAASLEHDDEAVAVLLRLATSDPVRAAKLSSELIRQLAAALVIRHNQLGAIGATS